MPKNMNKQMKKKRNPQQKKKSPPKVTPGRIMMPSATLSHCALKYATAISDPWSPEAEGACIPRHPSRPSLKVKGFGRFKMTIGSGGVGFAYLVPNTSNDTPCIVYSNAAYTGTNANVGVIAQGASATVGVSVGSLSGLPFGYTKFLPTATAPPAISGRVVASALSWQYTGTVSNMGGVSYALVHPEHGNTNNIGTDSIGTYAETQVMRVDAKRHWLAVSGQDDHEFSYPEINMQQTVEPYCQLLCPLSNGQTFSSNASDVNLGGAPAAIWIQGTSGNTFEVVVVMHIEYVGSGAQYGLTPTHSDSNGFEIVQTAAARIPALAQQKPTASRPSLMTEALKSIGHELSPVVQLAGKGLMRTAGQAIAGGIYGGLRYGVPGIVTGAALGAANGALMIGS